MYEIPRDNEKLQAHLEQMRRDLYAVQDGLMTAHGYKETDVRVTGLAKMYSAVSTTSLGILFLDQGLMNKDWWARHADKTPTTEEVAGNVDSFQRNLKILLLQLSFSAIESTFRSILRQMDRTACNGGNANFESIYQHLLKKRLAATPPRAIELLDFARTLRNTLHNNGVFYPTDGLDRMLPYLGQTYTFKAGQKVNFASWDLVLDVVKALGELMATVASDPTVISLSGVITDPAI